MLSSVCNKLLKSTLSHNSSIRDVINLLHFCAAEINEISTIAYSVVFCFRVEAKILINFYLVGLDGVDAGPTGYPAREREDLVQREREDLVQLGFLPCNLSSSTIQ